MGLISHDWSEVQNAYLISLGAKISGFRWISALIRKLWNTAWDIWNFRNHILHATYAPKKTEILALINIGVSLHFNRGILGLPLICHFLFKTNINTLLSWTVCQQLSWLAAVSRSRQCSQIIPNRRGNIIDPDHLLLSRIHSSRIIPSINTFDQSQILRTVAGPDKYRSFSLKYNTTPCSTKTLFTTKT